MAVDMEAQVAQDLRAEAIAQADILKSDHAILHQAGVAIRPGEQSPGVRRRRQGRRGYPFFNRRLLGWRAFRALPIRQC